MFRNYLSAAWRSALRDRLYAILNVAGLGIGLGAAILIGLFVRDELSFNHFVPGYRDVYRTQLTLDRIGRPPVTLGANPATLMGDLRLAFPEITAATRILDDKVSLRHGDVAANEEIIVADPDFFKVLPFPLLSGDPATALSGADTMVLSRKLAVKYFGTIDCMGQMLEVNGTHPVRITGVMEDLPSNSTVDAAAVLSGPSSFGLADIDKMARAPRGSLWNVVETYVRVSPTGLAAIQPLLPEFVRKNYPDEHEDKPDFTICLRPLADLHLWRSNPGTADNSGRLPTLWAVAVTGAMILLLAAINFVNLVTARATRRAVEVGIRKALGATRRQLILQFMGESIAYALAGLLVGMALAELCLPRLNAFLDRTMRFDYFREPLMLLVLVSTAVLIGVISGIYPALVLSGFRPALVLKSRAGGGGSGRLRLALVVLQFAVSIGLLIATGIIWRQTDFAMTDGLRFATDQILTIQLDGMPSHTNAEGQSLRDASPVEAMKTRLAAIPGVRAVAASWTTPDSHHDSDTIAMVPAHPDRPQVTLERIFVDYGFLELYGLKPIAGRSLDEGFADDAASEAAPHRELSTLINETAVRVFGFGSPQAAIGQEIGMPQDDGTTDLMRVVGVVPDFSFNGVRDVVTPTSYTIDSASFDVLSLKLSGTAVPETLAAIDRVWRDFVPNRPIDRSFVDDAVQRLYRDIIRQGTLFAVFAGVAMVIGCLGLFGLSAFTAERRTKEIGVRKALGASTADVVRLLVWQFVKPVLLANLIAWPIAWWAMRGWLDGFAYRIELDPILFLAAGLGALAIAIGTTAFHAIQVARSRPVLALRYE